MGILRAKQSAKKLSAGERRWKRFQSNNVAALYVLLQAYCHERMVNRRVWSRIQDTTVLWNRCYRMIHVTTFVADVPLLWKVLERKSAVEFTEYYPPAKSPLRCAFIQM